MPLDRDSRTDLLGTTPLFATCDRSSLELVSDRVIDVTFGPGHVIARQGDVGTGFFVIVSGSVRVVRDGVTIATLGPGEFFGELSVLDGLPRTAQVIALEPTECLALATWDFEALVRERPSIALSVLRGLAGRLRGVTEAGRH